MSITFHTVTVDSLVVAVTPRRSSHCIHYQSEQVLKVSVVGFFKQLPSLILPVASRVQHVMLVFSEVTPSVFKTGVSCQATVFI